MKFTLRDLRWLIIVIPLAASWYEHVHSPVVVREVDPVTVVNLVRVGPDCLALVVPPSANRVPSGSRNWQDKEFWRYNSFSYRPKGTPPQVRAIASVELINQNFDRDDSYEYRRGGHRAAWFFWPVEQIDRWVRPALSP